MRLEQLQYFVQVVEAHSFNKAARKLNITQPALTNSIRSLEEELGVQLLVRSRRGCVPTSWGVRIYEDCRNLLEDLAGKISSWRALGSGEAGSAVVSVVAIPSACNYLVEHLLPAMKEHFPHMEIVLHEATAYELYEFMRQGKAHIAVAAFTEGEAESVLEGYRHAGFTGIPLLEDEYRVFLSAAHPLAGKERLSVADCGSLSFATYSNQYKNRRSVFQQIADILNLKDYSYVGSRENIMQQIAQNRAAGCFLYRMAACDWYIVNGLIRALPVKGVRLLPSTHYLISLAEEGLSPAERCVAGFIRSHYSSR